MKILLGSLAFLLISFNQGQAACPYPCGAENLTDSGNMYLRLISSNPRYSTASATVTSNLNIGLQALSDAWIPNGSFQILFAATSSAGLDADGNPDFNAYDTANLTVECPNSIATSFDFSSPQISTVNLDGIQAGQTRFHLVTCPYTGNGVMADADFGYSNTNYFQLNNLINPLADDSLDSSQVIFTPIWVRQLDKRGNIIFNQVDAVGMARMIQVSAKVSPHITFTLEGVAESTSACKLQLAGDTTAQEVNFAAVNEKDFVNLAQKITVLSNNVDFVVTASENDQMGLENSSGVAATCPEDALAYDNCIPNATVANMTATQTQPWLSPEEGKGLAYTMENITGNSNAFSYTDGFRHFADQENGEMPVTIISNTAQSLSSDYLCYRLVAKKTNINGYYHNYLTYTLTATF